MKMNAWLYVRVGLTAASFLGGAFTDEPQHIDFGLGIPEIAAFAFLSGIVGMLFVIGIQAFNPLSDAEWAYPSWALNPFRLGQPLQFFHLGGYFMLAAGVGALLRSLFVDAMPLGEPVLLTFLGAGILVGVRCCTRVFKHKMVLKQEHLRSA